MAQEPHVCRGLNTCKGKGAGAKNDCAGQGDCATAKAHTCAGDNDCAGLGGCNADVKAPGENACKGKGGCHVPIKDSKVWGAGPQELRGRHEEGLPGQEGRRRPEAGRLSSDPVVYSPRPGAARSGRAIVHFPGERPRVRRGRFPRPLSRNQSHAPAAPRLRQPRTRRRPAHRPLPVHPAEQPAGGLVRDHLRELHGLRRPAALRPGADRRALPGGHARRLAVDRQHRPAQLRLSEKAQEAGRRRQRPLGVRPSVLDRRGRPQRPRPAAHPAQRGNAGPRPRPRPHRAGSPRTAAGAGEPQHLRHLRRLDDARVGVPDAAGRRRRLRPACST